MDKQGKKLYAGDYLIFIFVLIAVFLIIFKSFQVSLDPLENGWIIGKEKTKTGCIIIIAKDKETNTLELSEEMCGIKEGDWFTR